MLVVPKVKVLSRVGVSGFNINLLVWSTVKFDCSRLSDTHKWLEKSNSTKWQNGIQIYQKRQNFSWLTVEA